MSDKTTGDTPQTRQSPGRPPRQRRRDLLNWQGMTPLRAALLVLSIAVATIVGAWIFEWAGYAPCELCLQQRWAYYIGIPLAAATALIAWKGPEALAKALLLLLMLTFAGSAIFGAYHAGVEWGFWPGPSGCTGDIARARDVNDFMNQLKTVQVVRCDEVAIRILGLSLAGWNAIVSLAMTWIAAAGICTRSANRQQTAS